MQTQYKYTRLYNNPAWRRLRDSVLKEHPLCTYCEEAGHVTAADTVDHYIPHRGDEKLFWDRGNLRACCTPCHNHLASIKDKEGILPGCNQAGDPLDQNHPWFSERT